MKESNEWVNAIYKSRGKESGIFVYIDGFSLKVALEHANIPIGSKLKVKRYPLKDVKGTGKIVLKLKEVKNDN